MNLNMVPFGNAKISGSSVTCQHGPDECLGNSYEQCAIHLYPNASQYFPYYECMEAAGKRMIHGKTSANCAAGAGLDNSKIEACVNDATLSLQLQEQFQMNGKEAGNSFHFSCLKRRFVQIFETISVQAIGNIYLSEATRYVCIQKQRILVLLYIFVP